MAGTRAQSCDRYGSGTLHPGQVLGVVCHCFPPPLDVPTLDARCLRPQRKVERCPVVILPKFRLPRKLGHLLHYANLRHGTDGFTSPPKEGVLRIFFALKIRQFRPGLNPQTWVLKASTLPLDHRSHVQDISRKKLPGFFAPVSLKPGQ